MARSGVFILIAMILIAGLARLACRPPTKDDVLSDFDGRDFNIGRAIATDFFSAPADLDWGPVEEESDMTDLGPFGLPMSRRVGVTLSRQAIDGLRSFRIEASYGEHESLRVTVRLPESMKGRTPAESVKNLGGRPDLIEAIKRQPSHVCLDGRDFYVEDSVGGPVELTCTTVRAK